MCALEYDAEGLTALSHHDLGGYGDAMQLMRHGSALYVGHMGRTGIGMSIIDVSEPSTPRLIKQWPAPLGTNTKKVQVANGYLLTNQEPYKDSENFSAGMPVYSLEDPFDPKLVGHWDVGGKGVHRIVWEGGRYAYLSARPEGYRDRIWMIVDMEDPTNPTEAGRWWWPGQRMGETPTWAEGARYKAHHALVRGNRAYLGYNDGGMVILDISEIRQPKLISSISWPGVGQTHTCLPLPGRNIVVVTDESTREGSVDSEGLVHVDAERVIHIVDIIDEMNPRVIATCPQPAGSYGQIAGRFGPHNLHENRPGTYASSELVFATYFAAGLRVYDLADPSVPKEIAHWLPKGPPGQAVVQSNDLLVDSDLYIYVSDRLNGGIHILEPNESLRRKMEQTRTAPASAVKIEQS